MTLMSIVVITETSVSDASTGGYVLVDMGNGQTEWTDITDGNCGQVLERALSENDHAFSLNDGIVVDGKGEVTIGDTVSSWRYYEWDGSEWKDLTSSFDPFAECTADSIAIGHYPEGILPMETPEYRSSWTMMRGDGESTGYQYSGEASGEGHVAWTHSYGNSNYVCSTVLIEGPHAYVVAGGGYTSSMSAPTLHCYDRFTGKELWSFEYNRGAGYETATGAIIGDRIYLPATEGILYSIPLDGDLGDVRKLEVPTRPSHDLSGSVYSTGPASIVYDSGVLYFGASDGNVYCVDLDLNIIWKTEVDGRVYFVSPTVHDGVVYCGALDGVLYAFDQVTGELIDSVLVHSVQETSGGVTRTYGSANPVVFVDDVLFLSYSDGKGMNTLNGGVSAYRMTSSGFELIFKDSEPGLCSTYLLPYVGDGFKGVYGLNYDGLFRVSVTGDYELLTEIEGSFKAPLILVNDSTLYATQYDRPGKVFVMDLDGDIIGQVQRPSDIDQYTMSSPVFVDGMLYNGTDGGVFAYAGEIVTVPQDPEDGMDGAVIASIVILVILVIIALVLLWIKRSTGVPPIAYIRGKLADNKHSGGSKVKRNKRRLVMVLVIGLIITFVLFVASLMFGPSGNYSFAEALSYFGSGLSKTISGGELSYDETIVFDSRGSRAVATLAVGIGLSISGSIYQAIIRNPMVDPYIMGVSAGAGVAAVSTIAFNFTFFGLLDSVTYATPIVAMVGGLVAFACTMILAEKSGGSSINYVLAGVIVGLVFSALQTLMLSMAGDKLNSAMSWLFGSFANIGWDQAILVLIPSIAMSLVPLVWAKEFNLVLLGEDQARQMGLDVRRFNRWMLILASVLASVCVAFVGIIGFVGLVVPHLCRMLLGGDHRLVMPASMVVGAALMIAADLFSKMIMAPMELPVGAITTVIGAPVFAYLLIKKGRMYDG